MNKKRLVTILGNTRDRSYTDEVLEVVSYSDRDITFKTKKVFDWEDDMVTLPKSYIKRISNAEFFKTKVPSVRYGYKTIRLSENKTTGDRSFIGTPYKMIAENDTHIQVVINWVDVNIKTLPKHEYDLEVL